MAHEPTIPRTNEGLADLHLEIASSLAIRLRRLARSLRALFGEQATRLAFTSLLLPESVPADQRSRLHADLRRKELQRFLDNEHSDGAIDTVELTVICRQAAEYADQGCAPAEQSCVQASIEDRERRIRNLIAKVVCLRPAADALIGAEYAYLWDAFDARRAIDGFGGKVPLKGLRVIAALPMAVMRTAVSEGELRPDSTGLIEPDAAINWLCKRREFCPSRWRDLSDDQWPFDRDRAPADGADTVLVPRDSEGRPFVPENVMRPGRRGGLSITIGKKGSETQCDDFYVALARLTDLAKTDVARWRRRNDNGNWGIVRARGAWVAVSKSEIARQIEALSNGKAKSAIGTLGANVN